jgi:BioD-like phosphotransacetylase family protein
LVALYLISSEEAVGKTAIAAGIGRHLLGEGQKVGYLKPILAGSRPEGGDRDALFMKQVLNLEDSADALSPLMHAEGKLADRARQAYIEVSQSRDVTIIEGGCGQRPDDGQSQSAREIAEALEARVIFVAGYGDDSVAEKLEGWGDALLGVIWNQVPRSQLQRVCEELTSKFSQSELRILGVLPEERSLFTMTVAELAGSVQGEILNDAGSSGELVENLMVGAMAVDSGLSYFGRKADKAAVVRSERPDMQMAALETSTRCLVISGDTPPIDYVRFKAEEKGVPIISTKNDIDSIVQRVEEALSQARSHQERKLTKLAEILERNLDLKAIYNGLGLAK